MHVTPTEPAWTPDLPVFLSPAYLGTESSDWGWLADDAGTFAVPYVVRRKAVFRWVQLQFQPVALGEGEGDEAAFLGGVVEWCRSQGYDFIAQPPTTSLFSAVPEGATRARFGSYVVDLRREEDDLWAAVHQKHRNVIRKARETGVEVQRGADLASVAHSMLASTMARSDMAFMDEAAFTEFVRVMGDSVEIAVAFLGDEPQSCAVLPFSRWGAHYLWGGSAENPAAGAANLLHWEEMRSMRAAGVARYDFVGARLDPEPGSKLEGIQRFKSRFGGELHEGWLWKYALKPAKYSAYEALRRTTGRSPDVIDQELAREAGRD